MEGVKGFLKGLGTGALSVLAKPTLGVVDLVHFTLEGIKWWDTSIGISGLGICLQLLQTR